MWPDDGTDLPIEVHAAFGADLTDWPESWAWTDLTDRLLDVPVRIRSGRSAPGAPVSAGSCTVTLDNDDGALTPLHPMSPWWPDVDLGVPLRVRLRRVEDGFDRTVAGDWGLATSGDDWSTFAAGGTQTSADWSVSGGVGYQFVPAANAFRACWLPDVSVRDLEVAVTVDLAVSDVTGAAVEPTVMLRMQDIGTYYMVRVTINASEQVSIALHGPSGVLATASVPVITWTGQPIRIRASAVGFTLAARVWDPAVGEPPYWNVLVADTQITAAGGVGIRSGVASGNSNTKPVEFRYSDLAVWVDRAAGYADQWEPTVVTTTDGSTSAVRVTASGILRRLGQGTPPSLSPMRRSITASDPDAYWPLEDGSLSTQAGAVAADVPIAVVTGAVEFRAIDDYTLGGSTIRYGASTLADLSGGGRIGVTLPTAATVATASQQTLHVAARVDATTIAGNVVLLEWLTASATHPRWQLVVTPASRTQVIAYTPAGAATTVIDHGSAAAGFEPWIITLQQSGGNIAASYVRAGTGLVDSGAVAGTLAGVTAVTVNATGTTASIDMPAGHLAVWALGGVPYPVSSALVYGEVSRGAWQSYQGEPAHDRIARIASEDRITMDTPPTVDESVQHMGWQEPGSTVDLLRECEQAEGGILHEQGHGLGYIPRVSRYNPPVALTIDLATYRVVGGQQDRVLVPVRDDQALRNRWEVSRRDGSFAVAEGSGSQARHGVRGDSAELALLDDDPLADQAGWRLHLSQDTTLREQAFPLDLAANPDLIDGWLSCGVGSRIARTNPPTVYPPGVLDRLVEGWTEVLAPRQWLAQVVPAPAPPWDVATTDGDPRVCADGSTLHADITASATTLQIVSASSNGPWTTDPSDFPLDVRVGGERVRAEAPGAVLNINPWLINDGDGWELGGGASAATWVDTVTRPGTPYGSYQITAAGGSSGGLSATGAARVPVAASTQYVATIWVYVPTGSVTLGPAVDWHNSGGAYLSTAIPTATAVPAGVWTPLTAVVTSHASAAGAEMRARHDAATTAGTVYYVTALTLTPLAGTTSSPQTVTAARAINGVSRAWPAGTDVDVWLPAIAPL